VNEHPTLVDYFGAIEELREPDLQWRVIPNGYFLDYWAMPQLKLCLWPATLAFGIAHREAEIPSSGNFRLSFTYSFDVVRFIVGLLDLDKWPEES
jgi:hypothetical protein